MNLDQFIAKYTGQSITNNGGTFKGECVSLAARYAQEVQDVPNADGVLYCSNTGGARDLYEQFDGKLPQYYDRIPFGQPRQKGDLVVWGDNLGKYGDVAIALDSGNTVFGQLGTPVFAPARVRVETRQPLGYLRLKGSEEPMDRGAIINRYKLLFNREPSEDEINIWLGRPYKDVDDALFASDEIHARMDKANNYDAIKNSEQFAYGVANARGDRGNQVAQLVGAKDFDDVDTMFSNINKLKESGGDSVIEKDTNTKVNWLVDGFKKIFNLK